MHIHTTTAGVTRPINTSSPPTPRPRSTGIRNRSGAFIETAVEEEDWTGDSGMGTGSGTASYEAVFEWRQALKQPPPGMYLAKSNSYIMCGSYIHIIYMYMHNIILYECI